MKAIPALILALAATLLADSMMAAVPPAVPVLSSAAPRTSDGAANKKLPSPAAFTVTAGGLPIILTAPHGGSAAIPGVPERKGDGVTRFNPRVDTNTDILTEKLADALEQKLGKRPYVVIARFHRKYLDANRRPQDAFESAEAKATYDAYHAAIASACKEVTARWGRGVVLDIHGQAAHPDVVLRGTQNGKTVAHLLKRSGRVAVYGEPSLFGQLAKQGFAVFPAVGSSDPESPNYSGGHTVGIHGSSSGGTIDAIQLELGTNYRDAKAIGDGADKLAAAIIAFAKAYLPAEEQKPQATEASKRTGKIAIGVYSDKGAGPSVNDLLRELAQERQTPVPKSSAGIPGVDPGDIPPPSGVTAGKQRTISPEGIEFLQQRRKSPPFGAGDFDLKALRAVMGGRNEPTRKDIRFIRVQVGKVPCEWVLAPGADPEVRLLYLHGGGFVSGSGGKYLSFAAHLSAAAKCAVLLPDYRLAPEHPFPAGLDDCVRAHEWLVANGPAGPARARATFIAGDSAGGSLTLATLLALRDRRLQLPAAAIPISACTDFTLASGSLKTVDDPIISAKTMAEFRDLYLGKQDPKNPLASPVFGDYRGLPPLLVQVGEHEMLRDDSVRVARKARADGIVVKLEVWPGMVHVFPTREPLLPEAKEAIEHIADFMRSSLPQPEKIPDQGVSLIQQDAVWTGHVEIRNEIRVRKSRLAIEAGATVEFKTGGRIRLEPGASPTAKGTAEKPIRFLGDATSAITGDDCTIALERCVFQGLGDDKTPFLTITAAIAGSRTSNCAR